MKKEKHSLSEEMLHYLKWLQSNKKSKKYQSQDSAIALFLNIIPCRELLRIKAYVMGSMFLTKYLKVTNPFLPSSPLLFESKGNVFSPEELGRDVFYFCVVYFFPT